MLARFKKLQNFNVFINGLDLGMPAENAWENNLDQKNGLKKYQHNENTIKKLGLSIDWDREISTCS